MVLQHDRVGVHAVDGLRVAIAADHRQVQPEGVTVLDDDVARFTATQSVDASVERLAALDQHFNFRVAAMDVN